MVSYITVQDNEIVELEDSTNCDWINVYPPFRHGELEYLAELADIPIDFLTDSIDVDERSRYERDEDITLILVNSPVLNDDSKENEAIYITIPIGIILTSKYIITVCAKENPVIEKFLENRVKLFNPADKPMFVIQIFEQIVYRYLEYLKKLNLRRNLIEQELYNSSRNSELQQLLRIEKSLV
ncbi:MAG: CorA family divalent cation transporter, partial [Saprospiraceae bacterium]